MRKTQKEDSCCPPTGIGRCKVESLVSVDERGQLVLPKEIRDRAGIKGADTVGGALGRRPATTGAGQDPAGDVSGRIGYSAEEMESVPQGANLGLGCGNPTALASLEKGENVLELGAGGGVGW